MKNLSFIIMTVLAAILSSCGNEDHFETAKNQTGGHTHYPTRSAQAYEMLSFKDEAAFQTAVNSIQNLNSPEDKAVWVKKLNPNFTSIQDIYMSALSEADSIGETAEAYTNFVGKYSCLYFPNEGDDAGFYIPMKDLDAAYLVSPNYEVEIGGNIVNLKDIQTYNELCVLGRTMHTESISLYSAYSEFKFKTTLDNIGQPYESDWRYNGSGKRKVRLKMDRQLSKLEVPPHEIGQSKLHIEVSFRKKTFVGWINYSTKSTNYGTISLENGPSTNINYSQNRTSSHDYWHPLPVKITFEDPTFIATFPTITGHFSVDLESFDVQEYDIYMNGAYCSIPAEGFITPRF